LKVLFVFIFTVAIFYLSHPPAKTLGDPSATDVQPLIPSPTLPQPFPFTNTVEEPAAIGAACEGHGTPGRRCVVLLSPCRDHAILFTNTVGDPCALVIPEQ